MMDVTLARTGRSLGCWYEDSGEPDPMLRQAPNGSLV
jgi:hypothetical protein